ncbi:MAG: LytTR family DNA-binding domain-containing protein [Lachnospiraceae bacterium]|nr:LytTR family DNA-binding domain-containing protein [Lachnospiraceae bacterium]
MKPCVFFAVLDDNYEVCSSLEKTVNELFPDLSLPFHKCSNYESLCLALKNKEKQTGIIFVDICLGNENGIEHVAELQKKDTMWKFVYITGYPQLVSGIFNTDPSGIICKPISRENLSDTLSRIFEMIQIESKFTLSVQEVRNGIRKIYAHNILYIESDLRVLTIHTESDSISTYGHLSAFIPKLPDYFVLCHKSYIINTNRITNYQTTYVILANGVKIPVSRPHIKEVRNAFFEGLSRH